MILVCGIWDGCVLYTAPCCSVEVHTACHEVHIVL